MRWDHGGNRGFILIMTLWTLMFLTVLAVAVGFGVRQKITLLGRLEDRSRVQSAAEAGVKTAVAVLVDDLENTQFAYTPQAKVRRHNNPGEFSGIVLGDKTVEVVCPIPDETTGSVITNFGVYDELSKINVNTIDRDPLSRLIVKITGMSDDDAVRIADAIVDWRDYGHHETTGFFSDDYYKSLEFPYAMKDRPFERIDELLLVKGVTREMYDKLKPFVTVWGDGRVNVNTASAQVLFALGLDGVVVGKILQVRRGLDGLEATADDHVFYRTFDVASEVNAVVKLEEKETRQIDVLNTRNMITTDSSMYGIIARVVSDGKAPEKTIEVVFNALLNKYEYWYEK